MFNTVGMGHVILMRQPQLKLTLTVFSDGCGLAGSCWFCSGSVGLVCWPGQW